METEVPLNVTEEIPSMYDITLEDANWILTASFIIFTMQTGKINHLKF